MLKNAYFLEKTVKNRLSFGGSAPEPPFASGGWGLRLQIPALLLLPTIMRFFTLKKEQNNYSKCSDFTSSALLHLFFTLNLVVFVDRGLKIISCPRARKNFS